MGVNEHGDYVTYSNTDTDQQFLTALFSSEEMGELTHLFVKPENLANAAENLENYKKRIKEESLKKDPSGNLEAIFEQYKKTKGG